MFNQLFNGNCTQLVLAPSLSLLNFRFQVFFFITFWLVALHSHSCWSVGFLLFSYCDFFFLTFCNYFAAEFLLPFSSPPHFLSCSPVTLINFWPVDSAWVLLLKCAAAATAAALPHFFFLFASLFSFTWDHFLLSLWLFPLMHCLKECFDPKWVDWDKPWNSQQILHCVLFLEYVFFIQLTGVSCRPTNAYESLSF